MVHKLAIGTVQFGLNYGISNSTGKVAESEISEILNVAFLNGIQTIDTAEGYGNSESVLGQNKLSEFNIVSKFCANQSGKCNLEKSLSNSLANLNLDSIYGYLAHSASLLLNEKQIWEQLKSEKEKGRIGKIGYSIYTVEELELLLENDFIPDLIQFQYNILDRRFEPWFRFLKELGVEIHTRSCFLQGLFFLKDLPSFFDEIAPYVQILKRQYPTEEKLASFLMSFCLQSSFVDKVVIGVQSEHQLKANLKSIVHCEHNYEFPDPPVMNDLNLLLPYNWKIN
jgi:aryl-alcohol dehydrogenase-like predicted oxidoreductase